MTRYVIARVDAEADRWLSEQRTAVLDLPDAEHIHLTRLPDGSWSAVAMEWTRIDIEDPSNTRWRDVPTEPEDGACG